MIRAQMLFRKGVPDISPFDLNHSRPRTPDGRQVSVAWALVEATEGRFTGEHAYGFRMGRGIGSPTLDIDAVASPLNDRWSDETVPREDRVTGSLALMGIEADPFTGLTSFGRLFLRRTAFPVSAGMAAYVACGILVNPGEIPDGVMHTFRGSEKLVCVERRDASEAIQVGMHASHPFEQAVWGFDEPKRGFVSTLHPDVVSLCARHAEFDHVLSRTAMEDTEFARLERDPSVASVRGTGSRDSEYQSWKAHLRESGRWRDVAFNFDEFPTGAEIAAKAEAMSTMFQDWHSDRGAGPRFR